MRDVLLEKILFAILDNNSAESTGNTYLNQIKTAVQKDKNFVSNLVIELPTERVMLEVRMYNTQTLAFEAPIYFEVGSNTPTTPEGETTLEYLEAYNNLGNFESDIIVPDTFPYTLAANTYKGYTIIVPSGETIIYNGTTIPAGSYNLSGGGSKKSSSVTLDVEPLATSNVVIIGLK